MSGQITKGEIVQPSGSVGLRVAGPNVAMQPDRKIAYKTDGTAEGVVEFWCKIQHISELPTIGSPHPDDSSLECHHMERTALKLNRVKIQCFYHGICFTFGDISRPIIDYPGGVDTVPIQCNPKFADFAGTPSAPLHGAFWRDPVTLKKSTDNVKSEFGGFIDPSDREFFGVEHFFVNRPNVTRTYWTKIVPTLKQGMTIVDKIPDFINPPGIVNWLLLDTPYRQVGNSYQLTEQYKGAPEPGWSKKIYPQS